MSIRIQETIFEDPESKTIGEIGTAVFIRIMLLAQAYTNRWILPRRFWDARELTERTFGNSLPSQVISSIEDEVSVAMGRMVEFEWIEQGPDGDYYISRSFDDKTDERIFIRSAKLHLEQEQRGAVH